MRLDIRKAWLPCEDLERLPGHMGVYQLADAAGTVIYTGYAGGRSRFGLRGEIQAAAGRLAASQYRFEVTTAYLTRYQELLMAHRAASGRLPMHNEAMPRLGRLSPD